MNIQVLTRLLIFSCFLLLSFGRSKGIFLALERGDEKYTSNSSCELLDLEIKKRRDFPEYDPKTTYLSELPFSNQGALIDSEWLVCDYSKYKGKVRILGFSYKQEKAFPGTLTVSTYSGPRIEFTAESAYGYRDEVALLFSAKPVQNEYQLHHMGGFDTIWRVAIPFMRSRGIDLGDKLLYLVSSVATNESGDPISIENHKSILGFARCHADKDQDLSQGSAKFNIETESVLRSKSGEDYKMTVHCSQADIGALILMEVEDILPTRGKYQLVGTVAAVEGDSVTAVLCNQNLNTWIDGHIVKGACKVAQ